MEPSKPQMVKQNNLAYLLQLIKQNGPIPKRMLAELSGLSVVTINKLIPDLLDKKMITAFSHDVITGGRHAVSYIFNEKKSLLLIVKMVEKDKGIMHFFYYVCDLYGKVIKEDEMSSQNLEWEEFLKTIEIWNKIYPEIETIVLGIPGVETNGVIKLVDFPMLKNRKLKEELTDRFNCRIQIENDVNAAVLGYAEKCDNEAVVSGIYYPNGFPPGGGISIQKKLLKGKNNLVGEVVWLPLGEDWSIDNIAKVNLKSHLEKIIKSFISLYDPHEIVVYATHERIRQELINEVCAKLEEQSPVFELPRIKLSRNFNEDYLLGLITIGIREMDELMKLKL
ncbi:MULTISPECIES: ROK family protein [Vagococcus]|uniref:N-acetylglucosamine kinase bacterial type predicted homolog / Transcriptional regulator n=1 Tax=Vagococcus fluvialis bH819 TaxID=1255619 RepID=A0A1X6WSN5_9ENTE|nr:MULTISPECIES: ROK family protein [Vagococcus]SLM87259.1 N-acetylglucosamine kinase bacterial type predicted homolog / Transcriptional regulator [Vagococcus fluvialis bH819]HCM89075.1 ROK family protein [Vagococcus sp.]